MKIQVLLPIKQQLIFYRGQPIPMSGKNSLEQVTQETENLMLRQITGQTVSQAAQSPTSAQELTTQQPDTTIKPESTTSTTNEDFMRTTLLSGETKWNEMEDFGPNSSYRYFPLIHSR